MDGCTLVTLYPTRCRKCNVAGPRVTDPKAKVPWCSDCGGNRVVLADRGQRAWVKEQVR